MNRRDFVRGLILAPLAAPTLAAAAGGRTVKLAAAFPYLDVYLATPPAKRSRFYAVYVAMQGTRPAPDFRATIVESGGRGTPLVLERDGRVASLPSLAQLRSDAVLQTDAAQADDIKLALEIRPNVPVSTEVDPGALAEALAQVNAVIANSAGVLKLVVPKLNTVYFPGAGAGKVVFADGHATPLPITQNRYLPGAPYFDTSQSKGAHSVVLAKQPSRLLLGGHPRT